MGVWVCVCVCEHFTVTLIVRLLPQKVDTRSQKTNFACLEIHVVPKVKAELYYREVKGQDEATGPLYRVFTHTGQLEKKDALVRERESVCDITILSLN